MSLFAVVEKPLGMKTKDHKSDLQLIESLESGDVARPHMILAVDRKLNTKTTTTSTVGNN